MKTFVAKTKNYYSKFKSPYQTELEQSSIFNVFILLLESESYYFLHIRLSQSITFKHGTGTH